MVLSRGGGHRHLWALLVLAAAVVAAAHTHISPVTHAPRFASGTCCKRQQRATHAVCSSMSGWEKHESATHSSDAVTKQQQSFRRRPDVACVQGLFPEALVIHALLTSPCSVAVRRPTPRS